MTLETLTRREVATSLGVIHLWSRPDVFSSTRPLVVAIPGVFAGPDDLSRLPEVLEPTADAVIIRLPGSGPPPLRDGSLAAVSRAVGEVIDQLFAERRVVMVGASIGAAAALGVRAAAVRRVVAAEPVLATGRLWPVVGPIRGHLRGQPPASQAHAFFWNAFGVALQRREARDHRGALDGLAVPADVLLAGTPLEPERRLESLPSLVGARERAWLAGLPRVRLHLAPGAGHNVQAAAGKQLKELILEACRRASADPPYDARGLDEALLEATPLTARRVAHWGPGGRAFAGAYLAWNPDAAVSVLGEGAEPAADGLADLDAVALGGAPPPAVLERLAGALRPCGDLVARWAAADAAPPELREALARNGLALGQAVDAAGTGVLRARKAPGWSEPPVRVELVAFARQLMDVRTRLPARGLRSDPELVVDYVIPPHTPAPLPADAPKVMILQRQRPLSLDEYRAQMAYAIARGWIVVTEYDDHPALVAEVLGRPFGPADLDRFGYVHAVQTTVEPLAELFRQRNPEVRVFGNTVFELAPFPQGPAPRRVFYGAVGRGSLGVEVARSLAPVCAEHPDVEFVVLGDRHVFDALPTANKAFEDYLPYEAYLARMAGCAVSLSPVEASPARAAKSDAKYLDAARAGVVTIGSPVIYAGTIRHGENGLLAAGLEDWAPLLSQALADPVATRAMGRRAWEHVRAERMFARQTPERRAWYRALFARRAELNAAACARLPGLAEAVAAERASLAGGAMGVEPGGGGR